jgi:hypothetical protein
MIPLLLSAHIEDRFQIEIEGVTPAAHTRHSFLSVAVVESCPAILLVLVYDCSLEG